MVYKKKKTELPESKQDAPKGLKKADSNVGKPDSRTTNMF